jgi:competence protein ComEA
MKSLAILFVPCLLLAQDMPEGKGKDVTQKICGACHDAGVVANYHNSKDDWEGVIEDMKGRGADGSDDDFKAIASYLAHYFGPEVHVNQATSQDLQTQLEISAKDADAIVQYRQDHGSFQTIDDLKKVPGLDMAKIQPLQQRIVFQ